MIKSPQKRRQKMIKSQKRSQRIQKKEDTMNNVPKSPQKNEKKAIRKK